MAIITAAVTLPTTPGFKRITFHHMQVAGAQENPFTLQQQIQEWSGERLSASVTLPPMKRAAAEEWVAALGACRGMINAFMLRLPVPMQTPRGTALGTPKVDGAVAQTKGARVISTKGWTPNQLNVLKAGDWISLDNYLYKVLGAEDADALGKASFDIMPQLRTSPGDNLPITEQNPQRLFRLASNKFDWDVGGAMEYGIGFEVMEAF